MLVLTADETREHLPFPETIGAIEEMFKGACQVPLRHVHSVDAPKGNSTWLLMPAWQHGGRFGVKIVAVHPHNRQSGLPALNSTYTLFDANNGQPLAHLDGNELTSRRTAAASALAARFLSRPSAARLLVVGAGRVASLIPDAYRAVREIRKIRIWDVDPGLAMGLAESLRARGMDAEQVDDLEAAVSESDIVSCATLATRPLIQGDWLRPGMHLDLIGSFTPDMREADDGCFLRSEVYVDTDEAVKKSGDLLGPIQSGALQPSRIRATLSQLCRDPGRGRRNDQEITLFKAVGTALEDLAAASLAYDAGLPGQRLPRRTALNG